MGARTPDDTTTTMMNVETRQYLAAPQPGARKRRRPTGEGECDSGRVSKSMTSAEAAVVGVHDFLSSMSPSLPSAPNLVSSSISLPVQHLRQAPPVQPLITPADIAPRSRMEKNVVSSPQDFLTNILQTRGYSGAAYGSLQTGYHNTPSVSKLFSLMTPKTRMTQRLSLSLSIAGPPNDELRRRANEGYTIKRYCLSSTFTREGPSPERLQQVRRVDRSRRVSEGRPLHA